MFHYRRCRAVFGLLFILTAACEGGSSGASPPAPITPGVSSLSTPLAPGVWRWTLKEFRSDARDLIQNMDFTVTAQGAELAVRAWGGMGPCEGHATVSQPVVLDSQHQFDIAIQWTERCYGDLATDTPPADITPIPPPTFVPQPARLRGRLDGPNLSLDVSGPGIRERQATLTLQP